MRTSKRGVSVKGENCVNNNLLSSAQSAIVLLNDLMKRSKTSSAVAGMNEKLCVIVTHFLLFTHTHTHTHTQMNRCGACVRVYIVVYAIMV